MALSPAAVQMGQHFANFLTQHGYPVAPYTTQVNPYPDPSAGASVAAFALPGSVNWTPEWARALELLAMRLGKRGRLSKHQFQAAALGLHEGLHHMRYGRTPEVNRSGGARLEEGSTEASARDLLPIFTAKMFGHRMRNGDDGTWAYPDDVRNIRQLSVFGSGAKNYREYKARVWRRTFNHADAATRQRMHDAAYQRRVAWGKRRTPMLPRPDRPR